jgi:parallel beta-helix repeat protein
MGDRGWRRNTVTSSPRLMAWLVAAVLTMGTIVRAEDYWVTTTGNDRDAGTRDKPFATLERARVAVRMAKDAKVAKGPVTVWVAGGDYVLDRTFVLDAGDSGTPQAPVVYRSVPGQQVRLMGGRRIPSGAFKPVRDEAILRRLEPEARGKVLAVQLGALGITDFGRLTRRGGIERSILPAALELFFNDRPMTLARWPNGGYAKVTAVPEGPKGERFVYEGDRPGRWSKSDDVWAHGYFNRNWCDTYEKIAAIDLEKSMIVTAEPHDYRGYKAGQRIEFLNLLEELDEPGEWYLDRGTGTLYFWPPESMDGARVTVSMTEEPLVAFRGTQYVTLRGLVLECTRGSGMEIVGGHHNLVAGCTLRNIGTVAVAIGGVVPDLERRIYNDTTFKGDAGTDNGVLSCDICDVGECAIILGGGDRKTLEAGRNYAINNRVYRFGRWVRTYRPAVFMYGVANRVAHNEMHDAPHTAVLFWGNDHLLEFNEVYRVCTETGDAGAFYIGRDWSQRGTVVRHNYFHDLGATLKGSGRGFVGVMGVYLDDQASGITVFGNIFHRVDIGVLVGGGRDNTLENNIFSSCGRAISLDARGLGGNYTDDNTLIERLKPVKHDRPPYGERYPRLAGILNDEPGKPKGNVIAHNVFVGTPAEIFSLSQGQQFARELVEVKDNVARGDGGLTAPEKGDFRLRGDSPALRMGFKAIPVERIGSYRDEYR